MDPQNTIILIMGTPKRVPLILGNPHIGLFFHIVNRGFVVMVT